MEKRKREDGFTLIELMIVIAVIGILAIVLIPKVGTIKTQAKATGVQVNMRTIEGYVQANINNATSTTFETGVTDAFPQPSAGVPLNSVVQNPFVPNEGGATQSAPSSTPNAAFYVPNAVTTAFNFNSDIGGNSYPQYAGMISVYSVKDGNGNITEVDLIPFDQNGKATANSVVTVTP